ncbi:MAG TPA: YoaK family protein [Gemmatimonadaceae bacterium]|nr:YoaK family protein [Gemmatimonadaceae bacterium]
MRKTLVLLLSCAAGAVDAASYIGLGHVFAANMTGNTVHLGMAVGFASLIDIGHSAAALLGFLLGVAAGAGIVERDDSPAPWPRAVSVALVCEMILLAVTAAVWAAAGAKRPPITDALLLGLGVAMGVQSVTVRRLRIPGVASTYLTGTLTALMAGLVRVAMGRRTPAPEAPTHGSLLMASVWAIYGGGAVITALASPGGGPRTLVLPLVLIAIVLIAADRDSTWLLAPMTGA